MLSNYFKIAFRNLLRYKTFSLINLLGLSFSMSICLLVITLINDQLSYDAFHKNKDHIYRIITDIEDENGKIRPHASTAMPIGNHLVNEYSGIKKVATFCQRNLGEVKFEDKRVPVSGYFANQGFLEVFSYNLKSGNQHSALANPYSVVLTEDISKQIFGNENPLGKSIHIGDKGIFNVSGVIEKPVYKSHMKFDILCSSKTMELLENQGHLFPISKSWKSAYMSYVYILLDEKTSPELVSGYLEEIGKNKYDEAMDKIFHYKLQSLSSITPGKFMTNEISAIFPLEAIYIIGALALIVMLSSCFNYTNLSISRALKRAREVGIRKVSGAARSQLITQFLSESVLFALLSLGLAIIINKFLLDAFNGMSISDTLAMDFQEIPSTYLWFLGFSILSGFIAGIAPAILLSSFKPLSVLKNLSGLKLFSRIALRKSLIVVQFSVSLFFIITVLVIFSQSKAYLKTNYGFDTNQIINVKLKDADPELFIHEVQQRNDISHITVASHVPGTMKKMGTGFRRRPEEKNQQLYFFNVDHQYTEHMKLQFIAGNNFPDYPPNSSEMHIILNETAIDLLGYDTPQDAVGETVYLGKLDTTQLEVIGVVKDYHFLPLLMEMKPMALRYQPDNFEVAHIKINSDHPQETIAGIQQSWSKLDKNHVFEYEFMDEEIKQSSGFIQDITGIIGIVALLAIMIASLGLFGMAIYNAESKVKEIGIRKVMGAHFIQIVILLSRGFIWLLLLATIIATPIAYFLNSLWLQQIANRIIIGPGIIISGVIILLGIGLTTIGSQSIRAAFANPADSLRNE